MTADAKTVTVMEIHLNSKTVTVTVIWGKSILKSNKTAGNNFDSNCKLDFLWPKNCVFGTPFLTPKLPRRKFMRVLFLCTLSQEMRHENFFSAGPKMWRFGWGAKSCLCAFSVPYPRCTIPFASNLRVDRAESPECRRKNGFCED